MQWLGPALALLLLAGLAARNMTFPSPADAEPHHARVRAAESQVPFRFGDWEGRDKEVIRAAIELLHPNVIISRQYYNHQSAVGASLLLVHCKDASDLRGHYPPICYPSNGWQYVSERPWTEHIAGFDINGKKYTYRIDSAGSPVEVEVANVLVLPDGRMIWDMDQVYRLSGDFVRKFFGAGQVQVVVRAAQTDQRQRDEAVRELIEAAAPLIQAMRSGNPS